MCFDTSTVTAIPGNKNAFIYGCNNKAAIGYSKYKEKVIPFMFSHNHESFSFKDCNFTVQKAREGTGRYVVHSEFNVVNSYTLEASFFGAEKGLYQDCHFTPCQLQDIGKKFCLTLLDYVIVIKESTMSPNIDNRLGASSLSRIYEEIDRYFGSANDAQTNNYIKFMSKGDESDSADDDEPDTFVFQ